MYICIHKHTCRHIFCSICKHMCTHVHTGASPAAGGVGGGGMPDNANKVRTPYIFTHLYVIVYRYIHTYMYIIMHICIHVYDNLLESVN